MKVKTSELIGPALDWAVEEARGYGKRYLEFWNLGGDKRFIYCQVGHSPSTDWFQGGPILDQMRGIKLKSGRKPNSPCYAHIVGYNGVERWHQTGKTLLIAAMRCYVASKLGDEVEVPDELLT